mgnify:CR=1 FL=1
MTQSNNTMVDRFLAMIEKDQDNAMVRLSLGNAYLAEKLYPEAITHLKTAIEHDQSYSAAWLNLAKAYELAGDYAKAIDTYQKTAEIAEEKGDLQIVRQAEVLMKKTQKKLHNVEAITTAEAKHSAD